MDSSKTLQKLRHPIRQYKQHKAEKQSRQAEERSQQIDYIAAQMAVAMKEGKAIFPDILNAIRGQAYLGLLRFTELRNMSLLLQEEAWELHSLANMLDEMDWIDDDGKAIEVWEDDRR